MKDSNRSLTMPKLSRFILFLCTVLLSASLAYGQEAGQAYYDFGVFAYEDGDYEGAEKNLKKALEYNPDNPFYNHYLGKTYLKTERYQEAESYLNRAWEVDPDIAGLRYDIAVLNFKISNFTRSADLFAEIVKEDPSNVLSHYYAGISLYKQKQYGKALDYFIGAADRSPSIKANGYYYAGICLLKMGDVEAAIKKLEYVREHAVQESLRKNALRWLEAIEEQKKALKPYSVYLKVGLQYDDNVLLEPLDEDRPTDEDDVLGVGYFSGRYNFVNRQSYTLGAGYSHYQTLYDDLGRFDLVGSIFHFYGKYRLQPFIFALSYLPHYYWLEHDSFLARHQLRPEITWRVNQRLFTKLSYSYYRDNHFQDNNRDGHTNEVFLDAAYAIGDKKGHLFGAIGYEDRTASHPDQYYEELKARLGISLNIPLGLNLTLTGKYYDQDYDNVDSSFGVKREDKKYYGSVSLSHRLFFDWLSIQGEYNYTKNDSNISDYEYKRNVATLSLIARF